MSTSRESEVAFAGNKQFAPALLDPDLEIPEGMVGPDGEPAPKRFSVYRNNVVVSLMEALHETYPSLEKLVGTDNFQVLSRAFIAKNPPSTAMMQAYGGAMPDFLAEFAPLQHAPFLIDVARLESAWINAYHACDAPPLEGAHLAQIDPEKLMETSFQTHPATALIPSHYHLLELFNARQDDPAYQPNHQKSDAIEAVLVTRPIYQVKLERLNSAQIEFFNAVFQGNSLGECVESALRADNEFDATVAITLLLSTGAVTSNIELS